MKGEIILLTLSECTRDQTTGPSHVISIWMLGGPPALACDSPDQPVSTMLPNKAQHACICLVTRPHVTHLETTDLCSAAFDVHFELPSKIRLYRFMPYTVPIHPNLVI